jgi:hypothetical protein
LSLGMAKALEGKPGLPYAPLLASPSERKAASA